MNDWIKIGAMAVGSFLLGSIPIGILLAKSKGVDIRKVGSGNIGATNVSRALGAKLGSLCFFLDVAKGYLPALIFGSLMTDQPQTWGFVFGLTAVFGHMFSPFAGFRGGKGIATGLGALLGSTPLVGWSALGVFIVVAFATRYISLASVFAGVALIVFGYVYKSAMPLQIAYYFLGIFVIIRHRENIVRLLNGTESKFSFKKAPSAPQEEVTP